MPINQKTTTRVKVSFPHETKEALEKIAAKQGVSLSLLIAEAAIERHLLNRKGDTADPVRALSQQIRQLEERLKELRAIQPELPKPTRKRARGVYKLGIIGAMEVDPVLATDVPVATMQHTEALEKDKPLHIDNLVARFGNDSSLKGNLCQLGGRDGKLFEGDLGKARRVEAVTARLDPDNLPWFPVAADRVWWVQRDALSFVREVLGSR